REFIADLFISLDGFASGVSEAAYFGYFGEDLGNWVRDEIAQDQLLIMGRITYQALATFVPTATDELSAQMTKLPKLVFSRTIETPLGWKNTTVVKDSAADEIRALKQQRGARIRSIGSIRHAGFGSHTIRAPFLVTQRICRGTGRYILPCR